MSAHEKHRHPVYGLMAEFDSAQDLIEAANRTREAGYKKIDAYSPFPIEGMAEAIGFHKNRRAAGGFDRGHCGRTDGLRAPVLDCHHGVSGECRRQALPLLAVVHHRDVRNDDPLRRVCPRCLACWR